MKRNFQHRATQSFDARFGRWISADPYGQYWSPYLAMGNAPQMGVDPDGGWSWVTAGIGFGVGAIAGYAITGDWEGALVGGLAGGLLGGAAFDQSFKGWDGGTSQANRMLVLQPTGFGIASGDVLSSIGRTYVGVELQTNPRAQKAYNAVTQALVKIGQAYGEKEYVETNVKKGNYNFRQQYKFNKVTGAYSGWKIDPTTDITEAIGSSDLFVHNLVDPETKVVFNINYYGPAAGSGRVDNFVLYDNLIEGMGTKRKCII